MIQVKQRIGAWSAFRRKGTFTYSYFHSWNRFTNIPKVVFCMRQQKIKQC